MKNNLLFKSVVWVYPGMSAWRFLTLPKKDSLEIKNTYAKVRRGWGAVPVTVTIGETIWNTSIFPDSKTGCYLLPLKASVRKKEKIIDNKKIEFQVKVRVDEIINKIK